MRLVALSETTPFTNPQGEIIRELIGSAAEHGGAALHSLAYVTLPPGAASVAHYHNTAEETYYMLKGQARLVLDGQAYRLEPGQACLIQPGEVHQIFNETSEAVEFLAVCAPPWTAEDHHEPEI